jgi:[lysine-biosynthesis-protein LysW]--L-2-aminoadipate ligase
MICDIIRPEEKMIIKEAKSRGIGIESVNLEKAIFELNDHTNLNGAIYLQRGIGYFKSLYSSRIFEDAGAKVVNSFNTLLIAGNKILTTSLLNRSGIPTPRTLVSFTKDSALRSIDALGYPSVIKPVVGSWGRLVGALNDRESSMAIIEGREMMHPLYQIYYVQSRVKRPPRDIRSFVIGGRYITAIYRYAPPDDWRTNAALSGKAEPCPKSPDLEELSIKTAEAIGADYLGIDLMESEDGLLVHEANGTTEFKNTVNVTGLNMAGLLIDYLVSISKR